MASSGCLSVQGPVSRPTCMLCSISLALVGVFMFQHATSLSLCDSTANVALHKPTYQSSTYMNSMSSRAADGNMSPLWDAGSCTSTRNDLYSWWAVDLLDYTCIDYVIITNRVDCCSNRLRNFYVSLFNTHPLSVRPVPGWAGNECAYHSGPPTMTDTRLSCLDDMACGRYLVVQLSSFNMPLTLCEVQVFTQSCSDKQRTSRNTEICHSSKYDALNGTYPLNTGDIAHGLN